MVLSAPGLLMSFNMCLFDLTLLQEDQIQPELVELCHHSCSCRTAGDRDLMGFKLATEPELRVGHEPTSHWPPCFCKQMS